MPLVLPIVGGSGHRFRIVAIVVVVIVVVVAAAVKVVIIVEDVGVVVITVIIVVQRHSFKVSVVPVDAGPLGQLGFVLPAGALVLPGVQIHDQILRLRVTVPHLALVAVLVRGHLVRVEGQIG